MSQSSLPQSGQRPWLPFEDRPPCCDPVPIVEVRDLSLSYPGKTAFMDLSLDIHKGCITALVGPSGCGKTSFLMSMNRLSDLIPGCRVQGSIRLDGTEILRPDLDLVSLRRRIGMIFQKPNPFPFSIRRNLHFPLKEHGVRQGLDDILEESLRDVGLWDEVRDRLDSPAQALSGGQQQRLCLARALALKPDVLLLDEPCSALDPLASGTVEDMISRLRGRFTIVVVTHNLAQARRIADHVALFWVQDNAGRLIEFAPARQFFEAPTHELTRAYVSGQRG